MNTFSFKQGNPSDLTKLHIEGESFKLVSLSMQHCEEIFREFTPQITTYMVPAAAKDISETRAFIQSSLEGMKANKDLVLAIVSHENEFLGCLGFHGRGQYHTPELGIWLKQSAHGKGIGKMAVLQLLKWADQHIDYEYLLYSVDRANLASRRIPESLGARVIGEIKQVTQWGGELDMLLYRIG